MNTMRSEPEIERALERLHRADRHAIQTALEDVTEADRASARAFVAAQRGPTGASGRRWTVLRSPWTVALPAALVLIGVFALVPWPEAAETGRSDFLGTEADTMTQRLVAGEAFDLGLNVGYFDQIQLEFFSVDADGARTILGTKRIADQQSWTPTDLDLEGLPESGFVRVRVDRTNGTTAEKLHGFSRR